MKEKIATISIFNNLFLAVGKILVGLLVKSVSIFAEGIHSAVDVFSSIISLIGIKFAQKPVDKSHPYGHYKFEVLSGLLITIILFLTGTKILYEAYKGFLSPSTVKLSYLALGIMAISTIANEIMSRLKMYYGKKENSISLISDGVHDRVDVWASVAVFIGLILSRYWIYVDSLLALLIGLYIMKESFDLGKDATNSLLDVSAGEEVENKIKNIVTEQGLEISDLKTQKKGLVITANLKIKLPNQTSVEEATKISNLLRGELVDKIKFLEYVAIQIESHNISSSYFNPQEKLLGIPLSKGFGWQRKGKFKDSIPEAQGKGPEGYCKCSKCGYRVKHEKGTPCFRLKCPNCNINLKRE